MVAMAEATLVNGTTTMRRTCLESLPLLLPFLSASKSKNIQNIPCPTFADIASAIRALAKFTFSGDHQYSKPVTLETTMTKANFSGKFLQASGAIMLAAFLPKCQ